MHFIPTDKPLLLTGFIFDKEGQFVNNRMCMLPLIGVPDKGKILVVFMVAIACKDFLHLIDGVNVKKESTTLIENRVNAFKDPQNGFSVRHIAQTVRITGHRIEISHTFQSHHICLGQFHHDTSSFCFFLGQFQHFIGQVKPCHLIALLSKTYSLNPCPTGQF